jgi:hypothetical protein
MTEILSDDEIKAAVRHLYSDNRAFEMAWPDMVLPEARAVEPTNEMVEAACEAHLRAWSACEQSGYAYSAADIDDDARACIRAALRAALKIGGGR